jgi:hypothetical protein
MIDPVRRLTAEMIQYRAEVLSLRLLVLKSIEQQKPALLIDGVKADRWLDLAKVTQMKNELARLADEDPALSAHVKLLIELLERQKKV